jgi:hypothetical protein
MASAGQEALPGVGEEVRKAAGRFGVPEVYALIALFSFLVARFAPVLNLHLACPFRALTGLPCATCGMTHAFVHLAHGQLAEAMRSSPLGALLALGAWAYAVADMVRAAAGWPVPSPSPRLVQGALLAGVVALFANWAYLLARALGA